MKLKTEYGYEYDDFVQRDGQIEELTVEITLCEYRRLLCVFAEQAAELQSLRAEIGALRNARLLGRTEESEETP